VSNFTGINSKYQNQYYAARCAGLACGACPPIVPTLNDPTLYYVATCQAGHCTVVDLGATDVTACQTAQDCTLRSGTACCSGCSGSVVAINASHQSDLSKLVCGSEPVACPACAPVFSGETAICTAGRCAVQLTPCAVGPGQACL
jgi:hypothetical protein